jgi:Predicted glycosyltransferases
MEIVFGAIIPTRHRPESLKACLEAIYSNSVSPTLTIVGDDSTDTECIEKNRKIVSTFGNCFYLSGKCNGPSQNRKDLIDNLLLMIENRNISVSHAACIDDDIIISDKWFENASNFLKENHARIPAEYHIIYGPIVQSLSIDDELPQLYRSTFLGHFTASHDNTTSCVNIQAAIFPINLFGKVNFDQNIVYGYEDLDLCNRAIPLGYQLDCVISMPAIDTQRANSSLAEGGTKYDALYQQIQSARLYTTFKKYLCIERNPIKAYYFLAVFSLHLIGHLMKLKRSPTNIFPVYMKSKVWRTFKCSSHETRGWR